MESYVSEFLDLEPRPGIGLSVCQCGWQDCRAGHSHGPSVREFYVLHYVVRGRGIYRAGDTEYHVEKGQGFLIRRGDMAYYRADDLEPWEYYWVGFYGNEAAHLVHLAGLEENLVFSGGESTQLERHIADIYYASADYSNREYAMIGYLYLLFSCMIRRSVQARRQQDQYLEQAVAYIRVRYAQPLTVEEVAAHVGIDRTYLYRLFKEGLSMSVREYLDNCRMAHARDLLETTLLPVSEVAARVGIGEAGRFSRKFREICGASPGDYRKQKRRGKEGER